MKRLELMLSIKSFYHIVAKYTFAFNRLFTGNNSKQGRLTFSIGTDQSDLICFFDRSIRVFQNLQRSVRLGNIIEINNKSSSLLTEFKTEIHRGSVVNNFFNKIKSL